MDYKETLLMPKTDFPMRGGLPNKEPQIQEKWDAEDQYHKALEKNKGNETFILHDGPPYANGNLHMGHALNKILKDFIVRYKTMQGFYAPYVPGWIHRNLVTTVFIGFGVPNGSLNYILSKILVVFLSSSLNFSSNK
ncbi:isoleucyl-tRNA synthetase [Staphylococcus aureus]|nr:class I tRNA ligase family protein [Staphylococcus aureus]CYF03590.1 isoleucyl-tRNA synthetase [Staphylococcus aureus]